MKRQISPGWQALEKSSQGLSCGRRCAQAAPPSDSYAQKSCEGSHALQFASQLAPSGTNGAQVPAPVLGSQLQYTEAGSQLYASLVHGVPAPSKALHTPPRQ